MTSNPMRLPSIGVLSTETEMQMRVAGKRKLIDLNDIVYLKSAKNYTIFKLKSDTPRKFDGDTPFFFSLTLQLM